MSRRALRGVLFLVLLSASCTLAGPEPGPPLPTTPHEPATEPIEGVPRAEPEVRVGLVVDAPGVVLDGTGTLELRDEGGRVRARGSGPWTVRPGGRGLELSGAGAEPVRLEGLLVARPVSGEARLDGAVYRGAILLRRAAVGVTAVNVVTLEAYLRGVVPMEIGAGRPANEMEAVKAQAVAARTYAIRHLGRRDSLGFDFFGSVLDQAYGGAGREDPAATRAVRDTRGEIVTWEGRPIEAYYHSTCGGRTAASEEAWGEPRPYLKSVSDRRPGGGWYCEDSSRFRWTEHWGGPALRSTLTAALQARGVAGTVEWVDDIEVTGRTPSGRAEAVTIETNLGRQRVTGDSIRWVLRPAVDRILNSTAIEIETHGAPESTEMDIQGAGWGHGVGMCQMGALGRARDGYGYRDILLTYYPGTRIQRIY